MGIDEGFEPLLGPGIFEKRLLETWKVNRTIFDPLLAYVGSHYVTEDVRGTVTTKSRALDEADFDYQNRALLQTLGLIYHAQSNRLFTKFELTHLTTEWSHTMRSTTNGINVAFGFDW